MQRTSETDRICEEAWERAFYAFGTGEIFSERSRCLQFRLRTQSFVGILVPLLVGGFVMTFGTTGPYWSWVLFGAGALGLLQLVLGALSLVQNWVANLAYSHDSKADNFYLSEKFKELGRMAPSPPQDLGQRFALLKAKDDERQKADAKQNVTPKELRKGHRAGLRQFQKNCTGCGNVPRSMASTDCSICGRF